MTTSQNTTVEKLLDVAEVGAILGITKETARTYILQGRIPSMRVGRRYRVKPSDLAQFIERQVR